MKTEGYQGVLNGNSKRARKHHFNKKETQLFLEFSVSH